MSFCQDCRTREVQNERLREIITNLTSELSAAKEDGARLREIVKEVAESLACHCFVTARECEAGKHLNSCRIGRAIAALKENE